MLNSDELQKKYAHNVVLFDLGADGARAHTDVSVCCELGLGARVPAFILSSLSLLSLLSVKLFRERLRRRYE